MGMTVSLVLGKDAWWGTLKVGHLLWRHWPPWLQLDAFSLKMLIPFKKSPLMWNKISSLFSIKLACNLHLIKSNILHQQSYMLKFRAHGCLPAACTTLCDMRSLCAMIYAMIPKKETRVLPGLESWLLHAWLDCDMQSWHARPFNCI